MILPRTSLGTMSSRISEIGRKWFRSGIRDWLQTTILQGVPVPLYETVNWSL